MKTVKPATTTRSEPLLDAAKKALALLAHSVADQSDAAVLLESLMANYRHAMTASAQATEFDDLVTAMLLSVSSAALKQRPDDPQVQEAYRNLRPGQRH